MQSTRAPCDPTWWLYALTAAHLLLIVVVHATGADIEWSVSLCAVAVLSWWVGMVSGPTLWSVSGWLAGTTFLFSLHTHDYCSGAPHGGPWTAFDWITYMSSLGAMLVIVSPLTLGLLVAAGLELRRRGVCLERPSSTARRCDAHVGRATGYSLRDLLLFTLFVASVLSLICTMQPYPAWVRDFAVFLWKFLWKLIGDPTWYPVIIMPTVGPVALTVASTWLVFGRTSLFRRATLFALWIVGVGCADGAMILWTTGTLGAPNALKGVVADLVIDASVLPLSMLFVRLAGYRVTTAGGTA